MQFEIATYDHSTDPVTEGRLGPFPTVAAAEAVLEQDGWSANSRRITPFERAWSKGPMAAFIRPVRPACKEAQ